MKLIKFFLLSFALIVSLSMATGSLGSRSAFALEPCVSPATVPLGGQCEVIFPDADLKAILQQNLGRTADSPLPITAADCATVRNFYPGNGSSNIRNLSGVEYMTGLNNFGVVQDHLELINFAPIAGLPISYLVFISGSHSVVNLSPLANNLPYMRRIEFTGCTPNDLSPLATWPNLFHVKMNGAGISDISFLSNLPPSVTSLDLTNNNITDLAPISSLTNLTHLNLNYNHISDISPLANLTHLERLDLQGNLIDMTNQNNRKVIIALGNVMFPTDFRCGDGRLDAGELCDTGISAGAGACPTSCSPKNACMTARLVDPATCYAKCESVPISDCSAGDKAGTGTGTEGALDSIVQNGGQGGSGAKKTGDEVGSGEAKEIENAAAGSGSSGSGEAKNPESAVAESDNGGPGDDHAAEIPVTENLQPEGPPAGPDTRPADGDIDSGVGGSGGGGCSFVAGQTAAAINPATVFLFLFPIIIGVSQRMRRKR